MRYALFLLLLIKISAFSQQPSPDSLRKDIERSLNYLTQHQTTQTIEGKQYAGEWEAFMQMKGFFFFLGVKNQYRDSNCFTMAGIHNILAEMYLADTTQKQILPMLAKVYPEVLSYATPTPIGLQFNFWKKLPPRRDLSWGKEPNPIPLVRRPTNFILGERFINNAANVANDADDTALGNLAIWYHQKIFGKDSNQTIKHSIFDRYLDQNRQNRHWYNYLYHGFKKSGAYMTWLAQESTFENWRFHKTVLHNLVFFLPFSVCYPHPYIPYIPWGTNDVDVVVNANVLTYLTKKGTLNQSKGHEAAHKLIAKHTKRGHWNRMGIYYPNRYHFHFAISRALAAGDTALKSSAQLLLNHLSQTQNPDGSYQSWKHVNKRDILQSTTYALLSMLYLKESGLEVSQETINRAVKYIDTQKKMETNQNYWKGGVFFSGGTVVRNILYFTSDAYTTALVAMAYQKYLKIHNKK
ncbi:hypothetical protein Emtol_1823 [Emticicia oligotrophica DSM 17448]|uniref:Uncharacterized protein n=1 Tax=Emticicia oligotrophica (strain DSM 17448 / CIP 109782 / MTCC 6937 / GPTSA100-15) TaxID=929562 RepID=A0ABN4AEB1_EMTOG|nr:hypothetical protein [Emticicia oligotrophica]AFK02965.1 hypothetical protein Emtol_1823 [Emticicia oligotrophica DSM 17448]